LMEGQRDEKTYDGRGDGKDEMTDRLKEKWMGRGGQTDLWMDRGTERLIDRQTDRWMYRNADEWIDSWTD
jgi:hypothetical protein